MRVVNQKCLDCPCDIQKYMIKAEYWKLPWVSWGILTCVVHKFDDLPTSFCVFGMIYRHMTGLF
jgi:hypothetical protein